MTKQRWAVAVLLIGCVDCNEQRFTGLPMIDVGQSDLRSDQSAKRTALLIVSRRRIRWRFVGVRLTMLVVRIIEVLAVMMRVRRTMVVGSITDEH